jgi:hypothetical protein
MIGERVKFSMSVDPADRERAYVTVYGSQSSFINSGDMYQLALQYASQLTAGSLEFIQKDGRIYQPPQPPEKWI